MLAAEDKIPNLKKILLLEILISGLEVDNKKNIENIAKKTNELNIKVGNLEEVQTIGTYEKEKTKCLEHIKILSFCKDKSEKVLVNLQSNLKLILDDKIEADRLPAYIAELERQCKISEELIEYLSKRIAEDNYFKLKNQINKANIFLNVLDKNDQQILGAQDFKEEIIYLKNTKKSQENDPRQNLPLTGSTICRGVYLQPGDYKRSTAMGTNSCKIIIETKVEKYQNGNAIVVIDKTQYNKEGLPTPEDKAKAAIKFAKELLIHYKFGSGEPIILSGSKNHAEQASMVHAALLLLTSEYTYRENYLDPNLIKNKVEGSIQPSFLDSKLSRNKNSRKNGGKILMKSKLQKKKKNY